MPIQCTPLGLRCVDHAPYLNAATAKLPWVPGINTSDVLSAKILGLHDFNSGSAITPATAAFDAADDLRQQIGCRVKRPATAGSELIALVIGHGNLATHLV